MEKQLLDQMWNGHFPESWSDTFPLAGPAPNEHEIQRVLNTRGQIVSK